MKILLLILLLLPGEIVLCQDTMPSLHVIAIDNRVEVFADLPPLTQIAGAPVPFYTHFWNFGDGHFSLEEKPSHIYASEGDYELYYASVNNYDNGRRPGSKKKKVTITKASLASTENLYPDEKNFFKANGTFEMRYTAMAKPGDDMVLIIGRKNREAVKQKGTMLIMINEKVFGTNSFDTLHTGLYNGQELTAFTDPSKMFAPFEHLNITESGSPASHISTAVNFEKTESLSFLKNIAGAYNTTLAFKVPELPENGSEFSFLELKVTPQMIKDTNATIVITGVWLPEDGGDVVMHKLNVPVVNSHDPNKMNLKVNKLNYRFLKKNKAVTYKIRFQNNGKGPASRIRLAITLPNAFDPATISVKDMYPFCKSCDSVAANNSCWMLEHAEDSASQFIFKNIYLPGTNQKGVTDKDSTKGFVEFTVKTKKKLDNRPFKGRTEIYFDNNEAVVTNFATGRFRKSLSPVFMAGYQAPFSKGLTSSGLQLGAGISRLAPYRGYLQAEIFLLPYSSVSKTFTIQRSGILLLPNGVTRDYESIDSSVTRKITQVKIAPLQLRYNLNNWLSAGAGIMVAVNISEKNSIELGYNLFNAQQQFKTAAVQASKSFSSFAALPFADVQFGKVKLGPVLGFRYYYSTKKESNGYLYAGWRL